MNIRYYGLDSDLKKILFKEFGKNEEILYVFENSSSFFEIKREYLKSEKNLFYNFKLLNLYDFYEKLFITDKIVLKEEKQVILFYNSLDRKIKKELKINGYYDIIDIAYNFYGLFSELQEYKIDCNKIKTEKWQKKTFEILLKINGEINKKADEKGLILPYMLRKPENISENFIKKYKKICFINKVRFTPLEKKIFEVIEKKGIKIENILQLDGNDFDEKNLKINDTFGLPDKMTFEKKYNVNIEIHEFENKFAQLLGIVKKLDEELKKEKFEEKESKNNGLEKMELIFSEQKPEKSSDDNFPYRIYDAQEETVNNEKDYQLLNQNRIAYNLEITMEKTKIYKILNLIYNILASIKTVYGKEESRKESYCEYTENTDKKVHKNKYDSIMSYSEFQKNGTEEIFQKDNNKIYLFRIKELYNAFKSKDFLKIFNLNKSYGLFLELVSDDYKYISRNKLYELSENNEKYGKKEEEINSVIRFIHKMEEIYSYKTLEKYKDFLEELFAQSEEKDSNVKDKYFEALSEMTVLEDFSFDNLWGDFFGKDISSSLLKLFLKYLDKKAISLDLEKIDEQENEKKHVINSFSSISETKKENVMFLNLQDSFPVTKPNSYLFSKIQRAKMGLPVSDDEKRIEIFKFYQNILSAKNVYLSYIKNTDEKIDSAGVVEEIKLKYDAKTVINEISEQEELNFIKKYFTEFSENGDKVTERKIGKFIKSELKKNRERMKKEILSLGFYDFEKMKDFEYGFYLEKMIGDSESENIENKIDALMFGKIIHILYEKLVMENKKVLEKGEFSVNDEKIGKILNGILNSLEYMIPKEYMTFYRRISFAEIIKSAKRFLKELSEALSAERNVKIHFEEKIKNRSEKDIYENTRISGIVDLHIETDVREILVDYKSGKDNDENKARAFSQLDYYSAILPEKMDKILEKWVINTWNGEKSDDSERKERDILTRDNIRQVIKEYYETEFYSQGNGKDTYFFRKYKDIARREDELDDGQ